jgi:DNA-binding GntR family transcriptional regulator
LRPRVINRTRRSSLYAETAEALRELIIGGQLKQGERLRELELCERFQVSRTPLREALKILETEGLVSLKPNRGAYVSRISPREVTELFEVISNLERIAVELAIERMDERGLKRLERLHERMMKHHRAGRRRECFQADYDTHNAIVAMSGNSLLVATHEMLMLRARRGRYYALFSQARWDQSMQEHEAIIATFRERDGVLGSRLMHRHVLETGKVICHRLESEAAVGLLAARARIAPAGQRGAPAARSCNE